MKKIDNIAHRGARSLAPENTLAAIHKAWELGADGIEIDVALSKDHQLFLHHDLLLSRTTNIQNVFPHRASEPYTTFTWEELQALNAGAWFIHKDPFNQISGGNISKDELQNYKQQKLPSLAEVLHFVREKKWRINIEIKAVPPPLTEYPVELLVLQLIEKAGVSHHQVVISSFHHHYLYSIQQSRFPIEVQALIGDSLEKPLDWGEFEFSTYNVNAALIDEEQIQQAHNNGCQINLFTVNDPQEMRRFIRAGVQGIMTDFPHVLKGILEQELGTH